MSVDDVELRAEASEPSVWRLGDVLEELLSQYGLAETCCQPQGKTAVCGEAGLFSTAHLPAITASAY